MKPLRLLPLLLFTLLGLSACFHKNVLSDNADDIKSNFIYSGTEGTFIISWEEVFQANSKSSENGVTHISGYTENRLSSYKMETGEVMGRVSLGEQIEEAHLLLGWSPGKIWLYSINPDLGLHYRKPTTLEVVEAWPQMAQKPGLSGFKAADAPWASLDSYFAFDWEVGKVMLTDMEGFRYYLDPTSFALEKTEKEIPRKSWNSEPYASSGQFDRDDYYSMDGDPRKEISFRGKKSGPGMSYLNGEFVLDLDDKAEAERVLALKREKEAAIRAMEDSLARFRAAHPGLGKERNPSLHDTKLWEAQYQMEAIEREVDNLQRDLDRMTGGLFDILRSPLLSPDGKVGFIRYANAISDTARANIACIEFHSDTTWTEKWATHLAGFFYDPGKADNAGAFETVFSKGNPDFDYAWAGTDGKHLVLVGQLRMVCMEVGTGKILWEKGM